MRVSSGSLLRLLESHACELRFTRRRPKPGSTHRRMFATNDTRLLLSPQGRIALNFYKPTQNLKFDPSTKGLVCTWDIFMQSFRLIPADSVEIITTIKTTPPEEFWKYFNEVLSKMSPGQKMDFMDR